MRLSLGKVAGAADVVLNRKKSGRWGDTIKAVVTHQSQDQFEPWTTRRKMLRSFA